MPTHVRPSNEELKANMQASLEELKTVPPIETPPEPSVEPITPPDPPEPTTEPPVTPQEPVETPVVEATPPAEPPEEPQKDIDYKKKFTESSREAIAQALKNREVNKAIDDAAQLAEPTEDELRTQYQEWDDMTPTEQRLASDVFQSKRKFDYIQEITSKFKKTDDWADKVAQFVDNPATLIDNRELEGKTEAFKDFASKPTRVGMDFDDLILAFLGDVAKNKPAPQKGQMFPSGSGGPKQAPVVKDERLSVEESAALMAVDYKKWKEFLKAGKIRNI